MIDGAIETPSLQCFNSLVEHFSDHQFFYYHPAKYGMRDLLESQRDYDAFISLGSASNVEDKLNWHQDLAGFLHKKLENKKPVLGICFTHQLMANYYGAEIGVCKKDHYSTRKFKFKNNWQNFKQEDQVQVVVAHSQEIKKLPEAFEVLASSPDCTFEMIAHKKLPFIGIQAHPEASMTFIRDNIEVKGIKIDQQDFKDSSHGGLNIIESFLKM